MLSRHKRQFSLTQRLHIIVISVVAFCVTIACSFFEKHDGKDEVMCYSPLTTPETPEVLCYEAVEPTATEQLPSATETPETLCYAMMPITPTSETPEVMCYAEVAPTATEEVLSTQGIPEVMCYDVAEPMPTETVSPTPTPAAQSPDALLQQLLAEGRLPNSVTREL